MIIENKIIELYYIIDEFSKKFDSEQTKAWKYIVVTTENVTSNVRAVCRKVKQCPYLYIFILAHSEISNTINPSLPGNTFNRQPCKFIDL